MTENNLKLEGKLVESIRVDGLSDLAQEYAELGLDSLLDESLLNKIPIIKSIVSVAKFGANMRDRIYVKKILLFLAKVGETTKEEREKFLRDNCRDSRRFEEAIHTILERADVNEKASLIGKIFKACILRRIRYYDAIVLSGMVNKALWCDLEHMLEEKNDSWEIQETPIRQRLFMAGLYRLQVHREKGALESVYRKNAHAQCLTKIHNENYQSVTSDNIKII